MKQRDQFISQSLVHHPDRPRLGIKTFADMKAAKIKVAGQQIAVDSEVLFRRLFLISKDRLYLSTVLKHELSPVPPSHFYDDGTMSKTAKYEFAKKMESNAEIFQELPHLQDGKSSCVVDGMFHTAVHE